MSSQPAIKIPQFKSISLLRKLARVVKDHIKSCRAIRQYRLEEKQFIEAGGTSRFPHYSHYPCLTDKNASIPFERHYFYHPAWACRVLRDISPVIHIDISSIFSFAGNISAFFPTIYYEYQPPKVELEDLSADRIDLCALTFPDNSVQCLSCMHVIEHVGLGRYGDPLDPDGDLKAASELARVLAPNGHLLYVSPMAEFPRLEFNAHRVYSYSQVLSMFPTLEVVEFACVRDDETQGGLIRHASENLLKGQVNACGCFHFRKPA
jgi:SAM-dependent methyltransferase